MLTSTRHIHCPRSHDNTYMTFLLCHKSILTGKWPILAKWPTPLLSEVTFRLFLVDLFPFSSAASVWCQLFNVDLSRPCWVLGGLVVGRALQHPPPSSGTFRLQRLLQVFSADENTQSMQVSRHNYSPMITWKCINACMQGRIQELIKGTPMGKNREIKFVVFFNSI